MKRMCSEKQRHFSEMRPANYVICIYNFHTVPRPIASYRDRPEIRTLAQALQVEARDDRKEFLQGAFRRLEDIDNFVLFMEDAMGFVGTDFRFSVRTNMPAAQLDRMKEIAEDAINLRRQYLG